MINTKVVTILSVRCLESPRQAYIYLLKVSVFVYCVSLVLMSCLAYVLFFSWFSASWVDVSPLVVFLFVVGSAFKSAEFFSSFLIVMHRKKLLLAVQLLGLLGYTLLALMAYSSGFEAFVSSMVVGMSVYTLVLLLISWRVSFV